MSFRRQIGVYLGITVVVLGLSAATNLLLGPDGFRHCHQTAHGFYVHSHIHAGNHRHPPVSVARHPASPSEPRPDRKENAPEERYLPVASPVAVERICTVQPVAAPELDGLLRTAVSSGPRSRRADPTVSPRGPPV